MLYSYLQRKISKNKNPKFATLQPKKKCFGEILLSMTLKNYRSKPPQPSCDSFLVIKGKIFAKIIKIVHRIDVYTAITLYYPYMPS